MCAPSPPPMPEMPEPTPPPPTPPKPIAPDAAAPLAAPVSSSAGGKDAGKIRKRTTKRKALQQASGGLSALDQSSCDCRKQELRLAQTSSRVLRKKDH